MHEPRAGDIEAARTARGPAGRRRWVIGTMLLGLSSIAALADYFVAGSGNDANPGTRSKPFATLEAAQAAVRRDRAAGRIPRDGLTVWVAGGDYVRSRTLELGPADSGVAGGPVVWRSVKGERARLLGGPRIEAFQPVTEPSVLERLDPAARGHVVQCDLGKLGLREFGAMKSRGFGRPTVPAHFELFHGGRPMVLARWPNEGGFEKIAGFPEGSGRGDEHGGSLGELTGGFLYAGDRPNRWREVSDLWVHGYWAWDWANSYEHVASLDRDHRLVKTAPPHGLYGFRKGQRFYFLNVLEELDQPGEWYVDRSPGMLYFWPPESDPGVSAKSRRAPETLISTFEGPLIRLVDAAQIVVEGIVLEATRGNAIEIRGGQTNLVAGCLIRNVGNAGVVVEGGHGHGIRSCDIFDTGDGGVNLSGGDRKTLEPGGHFVENSHFQRQGRWSKCYVPAVLMQGVGMRTSGNLIHDHPHCAILYGGNDHLIEFNEIHHIALETGDVGAIYTGRDYTFRGNKIRNNFIHHTGGVGMGSMGAYMDDCVSGTEISGNIFFEVQRAAFIGGGRDHRVENNVFVDCNHAVEVDGRGLDKSPVWRGMVNETMRRGLGSVPLDLYRSRYPEMRSLDQHYGGPGGPVIEGDAFKGVPPEGNVVARNICVGKWLRVGWNAKTEWVRLEDNLTEGDPLFAGKPGPGSKATDFALRRGSPAWGLGFKAIPVEKIGLHEDALRRRLPGWELP